MILGNDGALKGRLIAIVILTAVSGASFTLGYFVGRAASPDERREVAAMEVDAPAPALSEEQPAEGLKEEVVEEPPLLKPEPASKPAPAPTAAKEEAKDITVKKHAIKKQARGAYSVQAGVFEEKEYAESFADKLKKRGYGAFIQGSGKLYKVKVGNFETKEEAEALARKLKGAEGIDGFVTLGPS